MGAPNSGFGRRDEGPADGLKETVVVINRAVAIAELHGADAGLAAMPDLATDVRLNDYQPYWASRAELLARVGSHAEARQAYEVAIGLERDPAVRRFLEMRLAALRT